MFEISLAVLSRISNPKIRLRGFYCMKIIISSIEFGQLLFIVTNITIPMLLHRYLYIGIFSWIE